MGNIPSSQPNFPKGQKVTVIGNSFTQEQVPEGLKLYKNKVGISLGTIAMNQSNSNCKQILVTRVYFPELKSYDTFISFRFKIMFDIVPKFFSPEGYIYIYLI